MNVLCYGNGCGNRYGTLEIRQLQAREVTPEMRKSPAIDGDLETMMNNVVVVMREHNISGVPCKYNIT